MFWKIVLDVTGCIQVPLRNSKKIIPINTAKNGMFFAPVQKFRINSKQIYVLFSICCIFVDQNYAQSVVNFRN
jgi:hypothetical protein